jgi:hypothetical protein
MFTKECTVNTVSKTKKPVYSNIPFETLGSKRDLLILGSSPRSVQMSFYDMITTETATYKDANLFELTFENNQGLRRTVICDGKQLFVTQRGYVNPTHFKTTDVFRDECGYVNRIVESKPFKATGETKMYSVELKYSVSTYVNGIQVK